MLKKTHQIPVLLVTALLATTLLAGCHDPDDAMPERPGDDGSASYQEMGFDGTEWPRLDGHTITVLSHGAFGGFEKAKERFENRTGATVHQTTADDTGSALNRAVQERGDPTFDVIYGIDNILFTKALEEDIFEPYKPLLAARVQNEHVFFDEDQVGWPATPVDHGYIAVNWDPHHDEMDGVSVDDLDDIAANAQLFVTQDPRTSTPGLGYLLATIATYGEEGWQDHWTQLFEGGVLVTSGWTEAYEQHFSGGYGKEFGRADRPIVTSYTASPAYEAYFGSDEVAEVLSAPQSTFHQVETMGIVKGTKDTVAAQAWIEFTLTEEFQELTAPTMAVYPVVEGVDTEETFGGVDPEPGSFEPADLDHDTIGRNVERWVNQWTDLCEAHDCA